MHIKLRSTISKKMIPLSVPLLDGNESKYLQECINSGWVADGKFIHKFESQLSDFVGVKYAVLCSNGTAALHLSLILSGVKEGDEVICPTVTFISPVNTVRYVGAYPVFMDCDDYLNIDIKKVKEFLETGCSYDDGRLINKKTNRQIKAIIPVHVFGHPVDMDSLMELADRYNLKVIEDATESLGSKYKDRHTGTFGHIGCFSFNGNKIITSGGGGAIVTNNKEYADKSRYLINQAKDDAINYIHNEIGFNYRLSNIQAAIGLAQLEKLDNFISIKRKNFQHYQNELTDSDLKLTNEPQDTFSNYWFYTLKLPEKHVKEALLKELSEVDIEARPLWMPVHMQKPYKEYEAFKINKAEELWERIICLPCSVNLKEEDIKKVCGVIKDGIRD